MGWYALGNVSFVLEDKLVRIILSIMTFTMHFSSVYYCYSTANNAYNMYVLIFLILTATGVTIAKLSTREH